MDCLDFDYFFKDDLRYIGIDEAGRGALCADMYLSACRLFKNIDGLDDSKKLSPKKREELFLKIKENSDYLILSFSAKMIDEIGLSKCLKIGLECIKIHFKNDLKWLIFDGNTDFKTNIKTMIKADLKIQSVMAASILSKVSRDNKMLELNSVYPQYNFANHKGYGTKAHRLALLKYGLSPIHRVSFCKKILNN